MGYRVRSTFFGLVLGMLFLASAPAMAQAAGIPGIESFFASNCNSVGKECKKNPGETSEEELAKAKVEGFTQAGGHPDYGITDFKINTEKEFPNAAPVGLPGGIVTHVRTDVAPGVSTDPQSVEKCSMEEFGFEVAPGFFTAPECGEESEIGFNSVVVWLGPKPSPEGGDLPLTGTVYNLVQPKGLASDFGVALPLPEALTEKFLGVKGQFYAHTLIEGNVEWGAEAAGTGKADYHDYFEINVSPDLPLISSRLTFFGNIGVGGFLTNPTSCTGTGPQTTTRLTLNFAGAAPQQAGYTTPIGNEKCAEVPFAPSFLLSEGSKAPDAPDPLGVELVLPHNPNPNELDDSQVRTASVVLPEGITLNTSAASGLEACTPEQIGIGTKNPVRCPEGSRLGTVTLNVPGLPEGALQGDMYLGGPASGPITGPPYVIYVAAESERYGVIVRIKGTTTPNPATGQLTTSFTENPEQPFSDLILHFKGGPLSPLANGLTCGVSQAITAFVPFTGTATVSPTANFELSGCAAGVPFAPTQATSSEPAQAAGSSTFTLNFTRPEGNQYLTKIRNVLPPGLVGLIPTVTTCGEAQANAGTCSSASRIGSATVLAGSGSSPYAFHGRVYLTGPYENAPYGLSIVVPSVAGPFDLGNTIARAKLEIDQTTAQVIATDNAVPMIVGGVPVRVRSLTLSLDRQGFERNPTNCGELFTESTLTGSLGATATVKTPFLVEGCSGLAFTPSFKATVGANPTKQNGASLETTINQANGQANMRSVVVTLPKQLPSRLSTLQKACPEKVFAANPYSCPEGSLVGSARANTPTLPGKLQGPAYLVSHGGAEFPDLDLVLEANGVRVIVTGKTNIKNGITTSTFATIPDVPVSSVTVLLPTGPHSALAAYGNLCGAPLYEPTTITGQNGKLVKQSTRINVKGCEVKVVGKKVIGNVAYLSIKTSAAGRISGSGSDVTTVARWLNTAQNSVGLAVPLNGSGRSHGKPLKVKIRVGFYPKNPALYTSTAYTTVTFG